MSDSVQAVAEAPVKAKSRPVTMALTIGEFSSVMSEWSDDPVFLENVVRLTISEDGDHWDAKDAEGNTPGEDGGGFSMTDSDSIRFYEFDTMRDFSYACDAIAELIEAGLFDYGSHEWTDVTEAFEKVKAELQNGGSV